MPGHPVPDPYRLLGVRRDASAGEIKAAHRRLAKAHHPDAGGDATRFLAIQSAYQLLADPAQRRRWDATHAPGPVVADERPRPARRRPARSAAPGAPGDQPGGSWRTTKPPAGGFAGTPRGAAPDASSGSGPAAGSASAAQHGPANPAPPGAEAPSLGDIYARSSGAAWSAASRAYFRRVAADIPRGARMGHSSRTGRVGWEPPADEIARAASGAMPGQSRRRQPSPPRDPADPTARAASQPGPATAQPGPATGQDSAPRRPDAAPPSGPGGSVVRNALNRILAALRA